MTSINIRISAVSSNTNADLVYHCDLVCTTHLPGPGTAQVRPEVEVPDHGILGL